MENVKSVEHRDLIFSDDGGEYIAPLSLKKRNLNLKFQGSEDKTVNKDGFIKIKTAVKEPVGEVDESFVTLEPLEQSKTVEQFLVDEPEPEFIDFTSQRLKDKLKDALSKKNEQYLSDSEKLYKFGIRKLILEEEEILEEEKETPGEIPEGPDLFSPKYQSYKEKWQIQVKIMDDSCQKFNEMNREASSKLLELILESYIEKQVQR